MLQALISILTIDIELPRFLSYYYVLFDKSMFPWPLEAISFINVIVSFDPLMLAGTLTLANKTWPNCPEALWPSEYIITYLQGKIRRSDLDTHLN